MKTRLSLVVAMVAALTAGTLPRLLAGPARDACRLQIPPLLVRQLEARYPKNRLPSASDSRSMCVKDHVRRGTGNCLLVTSGDFDGNGQEDIAVLMPAVKKRVAPKLVAARRLGSDWKLEEVPAGPYGAVERLVLTSLPPHDYKETPAAPQSGETRRVLRLDHDGLGLQVCDSWMNGYFRVRGKWKGFALSD
jgi:hypothetical protein